MPFQYSTPTPPCDKNTHTPIEIRRAKKGQARVLKEKGIAPKQSRDKQALLKYF